MSLYTDPRSTLLSLVERENNITLNPSDYSFTDPTPALPPEESEASYNTFVTLSANTPAAPYVGSVEIYYNRLNLEDLALLTDLYIQAPAIATSHDVIEPLNRRYGLNLSVGDLYDHPATTEADYTKVRLQAKPSSLGWIGDLTINVTDGDLVLEEYVLTTALGGLNYPTESTDQPFAHFYSFWRDFSDHHGALSLINTGDPMTLEVITALDDVTGDLWLNSGPAEYSLKDAQIIYSGPASGYPNTNSDYPMVLVIRLDPINCTGLSGDLVMHHSDDPYATLGI